MKSALKYSEVDSIKNCFVMYMEEIGFKQGLVFTAGDRKKLQK